MNKKTKAILAGVSTIAVIGVAGIVAYFTDTATVTNHAEMGIVDIDLAEYTINSQGNKVAWSDVTNVTPGQTISKIPEISVVDGAVDCYIRAKVEISCADDTLAADPLMLTIDNLNVDESKWYYCAQDGYFYYKTVMTDESNPAQLFTEVTIPAALGNAWSLERIQIDVTAEAIQSENFTPNFAAGSTNPWPGITSADILECIYPTHQKYTD